MENSTSEPQSADAFSLSDVASGYQMSMQAYRSFLDQWHPALVEQEEDHLTYFESVRKDLKELRGEFEELRIEAGVEDVDHSGEVEPSDGSSPPNPSAGSIQEVRRRATEIEQTLSRVSRGVRRRMPEIRHRSILYRSIIIGLVAEFEVLVSGLAHGFYRKAPDAIASDDKTLTVEELFEIGSIDDAMAYVIDREVDGLLRESVDGWRDFFQKRASLDLMDYTDDWARFTEFFQRRHILVHAGGEITRRYLEHVDEDLLAEYFGDCDGITPGDSATPNEAYTRVCLTSFESTGLIFCLSVWNKLQPDETKQLESSLNDILYERIRTGVWEVAGRVANWGVRQSSVSRSIRLVCQLNYWLAKKRLGQLSEHKDELESFDTSGLDTQYRLARFSLLDRSDAFFRLLEEAEGGDLDAQAWDEWPIFEEMRQDARFDQLRKRYGPTGTEDTVQSLGEEESNTASDTTE